MQDGEPRTGGLRRPVGLRVGLGKRAAFGVLGGASLAPRAPAPPRLGGEIARAHQASICPPPRIATAVTRARRSASVGEYFAKPVRERFRLAGVSGLGAEEATVVAGEHGRLL